MVRQAHDARKRRCWAKPAPMAAPTAATMAAPMAATMAAPTALATMVALALGACSADPPCGLPRCDIRRPDCQQEVATATACLRGVTPVSVKMTVVPRAQFLAEAEQAGAQTADDPAFRHFIAAYALLGLSKAELTTAGAAKADAAWVAAFYDPQSKAITIIDWGDPLDGSDAVELLVHEYTHALQDRTPGLDTFYAANASSFDAALASTAMLEGEATLVEDLARLGLWGKPERDVPWTRVLGDWQARARRARDASDLPILLAPAHFRYAFGSGYVVDSYLRGGWESVAALYTNPPLSTRQVQAGVGSPEPDAGPWREALGEDASPVLPEDFRFVGSQDLGAWLTETFLRRNTDAQLAARLAARLRGDALTVFQRRSNASATLVVWRLRFTSEDDARLLAAGLAARPSGAPLGPARLWASGRDVIVAASNQRLPDELGPRLRFQAIPEVDPADPRPAAGFACGRRALLGPHAALFSPL